MEDDGGPSPKKWMEKNARKSWLKIGRDLAESAQKSVQIENLKKEIEELRSEKLRVEKEKAAEILQLHNDLAAASNEKEELAKAKSEVASLQSQVQILVSEKKNLLEEFTLTNNSLASSSANLNAANQTIKDHSALISFHQGKNKEKASVQK